jgi:hypothetical protein
LFGYACAKAAGATPMLSIPAMTVLLSMFPPKESTAFTAYDFVMTAKSDPTRANVDSALL